MSQLLCPRCLTNEFRLTVEKADWMQAIASPDPVGTLHCPHCYEKLEFRARALPIFPVHDVLHPAQRFAPKAVVSPNMQSTLMVPNSFGDWVQYKDYKQAEERAYRLDLSLRDTSAQLTNLRTEMARGDGVKDAALNEAARTRAEERMAASVVKHDLSVERTNAALLRQRIKELEGLLSTPKEGTIALEQRVKDLEHLLCEARIALGTRDNQLSACEIQLKRVEAEKKLFEEKAKTAQMDLAREQRDRWMRDVREFSGVPFEARIERLTAELAACRSNLKATEQERDAEKLKLQKFREVLISLTF